MLHKKTVTKDTLDLIRRLMKDDQLRQFNLVGGTALALWIGHRTSIDIDLFSAQPFDAEKLAAHLRHYYSASIDFINKNMVMALADNIKLDMILHPYANLKPVKLIESIRLTSLEDIAAMKINAIVNSGTRKKDFYDIHFLLEKFDLKQIIEAYTKKYPNVDPQMARASLLYHDDIDFTVKFQLLDKEIKWSEVAKRLKSAVKDYDNHIRHQQFVEKLKEIAKGKVGPPAQNIIKDETQDISNDESEDNDQEYGRGYRR